jgi:ABC-2 type transport system ATP-binding protein/ribosome-dependent ATPase
MTLQASIRGVHKSFGDVGALKGVDLRVDSGEVVGLLGANGAGKTTLVRILLGLTAPDEGSVEIMGRPPGRRVLRSVGYVPQGLGLYTDLTVGENLDFQRGVFGIGDPPSDAGVLAESSSQVGRLPLGFQRRAAFAAALAHRPTLLVLDEPTSGVGVLGRARLWETIRDASSRGVGVLVTTHHLEEAEQCDRLVMLADGVVVAEGWLSEIIGSQRAVVVLGGDQVRALELLDEAGLLASFVGKGLRVVDSDIDQVRHALRGLENLMIEERTATLEEAFVNLVAD